MGFHSWVRIRRSDPDVEQAARSVEWETTCRYCGRVQGSGIGFSLLVVAVAVIAAVAVFWLWSPLLGAVMMIGAVFGLMAVMVPASIRIVRRLSIVR